ncbi:MAG: hypothetical protein KKC20_05445 [Proteobacteria bacterium]|nr:hypothetical protein [Pseudomonadota bacterium]
MEMAFKQVKTALDRLDELQESHIDGFKTQIIPDIEEQIIQRKEMFTDLKERLTLFLMESETMDTEENIPLLQEVKNHILLLMNQNKMLKSQVETLKIGLENSIKKVTKGKQIMTAYGSSESQRNQSKVINFRN